MLKTLYNDLFLYLDSLLKVVNIAVHFIRRKEYDNIQYYIDTVQGDNSF